MNLLLIDYMTAHTLPESDFPLLWKHLEKRKPHKLYEEYPSMISYVVAEEDNRIVGIIGFEPCKLGDDEYFYISPLEVLEEHRNQGFGTLLLEKVKDLSRITKLAGVGLFCREELVFFYSKRGFKIVNTIETEDEFEYLMIFENKEIK